MAIDFETYLRSFETLPAEPRIDASGLEAQADTLGIGSMNDLCSLEGEFSIRLVPVETKFVQNDKLDLPLPLRFFLTMMMSTSNTNDHQHHQTLTLEWSTILDLFQHLFGSSETDVKSPSTHTDNPWTHALTLRGGLYAGMLYVHRWLYQSPTRYPHESQAMLAHLQEEIDRIHAMKKKTADALAIERGGRLFLHCWRYLEPHVRGIHHIQLETTNKTIQLDCSGCILPRGDLC